MIGGFQNMLNENHGKYEAAANSATPALIIYLIDVSRSMEILIGGKPRVDVVSDGLYAARDKMLAVSNKGTYIANRYRIAYILYSEKAIWIKDKVFTIAEIGLSGVPPLDLRAETDTYLAFIQARNILKAELPNIRRHPAPLVCHITDGKFTGRDPIPVAEEIMSMKVNDGNVLIQNIFISDNLFSNPIPDIKRWKGITKQTKFTNQYAETLRSISSPLPDSYREIANAVGYNLERGSLMMFPGISIELIKLGFVVATSTPRTTIEK